MELTHFNDEGRAHMVDVGEKPRTKRIARAMSRVYLAPETFRLVCHGGMKKGDVLAVAQVAGIMAAKKNSELIPMCHPIAITSADGADSVRHVQGGTAGYQDRRHMSAL